MLPPAFTLPPSRVSWPRFAARLAVPALALCACHGAPPPEPARAVAVDGGPRSVSLPPSVVSDARVRTERPRPGHLAEELELPGEVQADPDRFAAVGPPVAGRVVAVHARVGEPVRRGDALVELRVPELARARADAASKQAMATVARQNADRQRSLYELHAGSEKDAQRATGEAAALDAESRAARSALRALDAAPDGDVTGSLLALRAPVAGRVIARTAVVGQPVLADQTLVTVGDLSTVWFVARVYEADLARVREGSPVEVVLAAYPGERLLGRVDRLGDQLDPTTRSVTARVVLSNPRGLLRLGLVGVARIRASGDRDGGLPPDGLIVPAGALVDLAGERVVFVRVGEGRFAVRAVRVATTAHGEVELSAGVSASDEVVVDGAFTLKSVALRSRLDEE